MIPPEAYDPSNYELIDKHIAGYLGAVVEVWNAMPPEIKEELIRSSCLSALEHDLEIMKGVAPTSDELAKIIAEETDENFGKRLAPAIVVMRTVLQTMQFRVTIMNIAAGIAGHIGHESEEKVN